MLRWIRKLLWKIVRYGVLFLALFLLWCRFFPAPPGIYAISEWNRWGEFRRDWINTSDLPPFVYASVIASEDAGFCKHNGVEWSVMWDIIRNGENRGGSTISQQMVKNLLLWHGESKASRYARKTLEIPLTLLVELVYPKERILEIYLNIVEFDTAVFGIEEAAQVHFKVPAKDLTPQQMALLTAVLPNPKGYSIVPLDPKVANRASQIRTGARDVIALGLDDCVR